MSSFNMQKVSLQELSDLIEESEMSEYLNLGPALLVRGKHSVSGEFVGVSTSEGTCAIIKL